MSNQEVEVHSHVVFTELRRVKNITDKALVIEREMGTDILYTLVSMGKSEEEIAKSLGLTVEELELIMCRTAEHRNKYIKSKLFIPAKNSISNMEALSNRQALDPDQGRASSHHSKIVEMFLGHTKESSDGGSAITVNNTVVVSDKADIPHVPKELEEVFEDADFKEA